MIRGVYRREHQIEEVEMHWTGMDGGWWVLMMIVWIALVAVVVWAVVRLLASREQPATTAERPEEILKRRLASGEIDAKTYDELRSRLGGGALAGGQ